VPIPGPSGLPPSGQAIYRAPVTKSAHRHVVRFREGDWVRHKTFPEPIRVIGIGSTIAVQFPNGEMRAFEPEELEKVSIVKVRQSKAAVPERSLQRGRGSAKGLASLATTVGLICL
jgi:hypothetical protein